MNDRDHRTKSTSEQELSDHSFRSEHFLGTIFASLGEGIIVYDLNFHYRFWNHFMQELTGLSQQQVLGRNALDLFPHLRDERVFSLLERARDGEIVSSGDMPYTVPATGKSGWVTALYSPHRDVAGEIVGVVAIVHDISERKSTEDALRESEEKYRSIFSAAKDAIIILDHKTGQVIDVNDFACHLYGYTREEMLQLRNVDLSAEPDKTLAGLNEEIAWIPLRYHRKKDGSVLPVEISVSYHTRAGRRMSTSVIRDITQRKKAEEALQRSEKDLRDLSSRLLSAQEEERKRIAEELHDSIGQTLVTVKMGLRNALRDMEKERNEQAAALLDQLIPEIQKAVEEIRLISTGLRPTVLDNLGIVSTIYWFTQGFQELHPDYRVHVETDIKEEQIPESLKIVIFRIIQEALHNVLKHSKAESVNVSLSTDSGDMVLSIRDDGIGFDPVSATVGTKGLTGMGLASIRERTEFTGGTFFIESAVGEGTTIQASWPCSGCSSVFQIETTNRD